MKSGRGTIAPLSVPKYVGRRDHQHRGGSSDGRPQTTRPRRSRPQGGEAVGKDREHLSTIGRKGAESRNEERDEGSSGSNR
jgi:hypothetical protein